MTRVCWTVPIVLCLTTSLQAGPPKLDLNDVTWLWPVPTTESDLEKVIRIDSLASGDGKPVLSDEHFEDVVMAADSDAARVGGSRITLLPALRAKNVWRIVAMRADPSAPGGHEIIRNNFGERPQLRLVLQPVTVTNGKIKVHDVAMHLVYSFTLPPSAESENPPDKEKFQSIVHGLDALKKLTEDAGATTSGRPLAVHPGLAAEVPELRTAVREFLTKHLRSDKLSAMAIMGLDGEEPWIFLALAKFPPGTSRFGPIPLLPAQMISFRSGEGVVSPQPRVNNLNPVPSNVMMPDKDSDRRGVSTSVMFADEGLDLGGLAAVSKDEAGQEVLDDEVKNRDIPDIIADPIRSHFFNTDCVSCHTETRRRLRFDLPPGKFAFLMDGKPPQIADEVLPKDDWNVRNLGWFPPSKFIGGGPTVATATQRTANETAEVVSYIERHYRQEDAPGEDDSAASPPTPSEAAATQFLVQGWTEEEREDFYYLGQGSQLVPYSWFLNLELANSEELFRSDQNLAQFGCIIAAKASRRNPDRLPVGFVKDDNASSSAMRLALLGAEFDSVRPKPSDEWLGLTCAACHTSDLHHQGKTIRIDGGAALIDIEGLLGALAAAMQATRDDDAKFARFEQRIKNNTDADIDTSALREDFVSYTKGIENLVARNKAAHAYGLGRLDAFGAILNQICEGALGISGNHRPASAPVSYPFLWDTSRLDWVQWNSVADVPITRNVGEVLGVFAHVDLQGTTPDDKFASSVRIDRLHRLETSLNKLRAPAWPEEQFGRIDRLKAEAGQKLFRAKCAGCHNMRDEQGNYRMTEPNILGATFIKTTSVPFMQIGTDPQMVLNFITRFAEPGALAEDIEQDLKDPRAQEQITRLTKILESLSLPQPDLTKQVPAAILLKASVRGTIQRNLARELMNRSEDEKREILIELNGRRELGRTPPNSGTGYKARPLNGVWATAPFGHAGSVPTLFQWLKPENERVKQFFVGRSEFDTEEVGLRSERADGAFLFRVETDMGAPIPGNSNKGHSGPGFTDFTDDERWQIIEFLKTLK